MKLTFGVLIEILEDWVKTNKKDNRIIAQFYEGDWKVETTVAGAFHQIDFETSWLYAKSKNEEDCFDEDGILVNDESPEALYTQVARGEEENLSYDATVGIEIWFEDGDDSIQYKAESHEYEIVDSKLIVKHNLKNTPSRSYFEFRRLLKEQY